MTDGTAAKPPVEAAQPAGAPGRIGVLLVNLGTPAAPTAAAVRRYLAEFLSDRRVVDYPRFLWLPFLYGVILNVRPARSARAYGQVWRTDTDESPLRYFTRRQGENLSAALSRGALGERMLVDWAMRYGAPSIGDRLGALRDNGAERVIVVPLYPQYSVSTTASVADAVAAARARLDRAPEINIAAPFYDEPVYIEALAGGARQALDGLGWTPERILISFHGLPERFVRNGDPYLQHCRETARLLRAAMGWSDEMAAMTFQSKFGPETWLGPATDETLRRFAGAGVKRVAVITPGFVADCLETLEEIAIAARETFLNAGGEKFTMIPCLNDSPAMTALLERIVARETV